MVLCICRCTACKANILTTYQNRNNDNLLCDDCKKQKRYNYDE